MAGPEQSTDKTTTEKVDEARSAVSKFWKDVSGEIGGAYDKAKNAVTGEKDKAVQKIDGIDLDEINKELEKGRRGLEKAREDLGKVVQNGAAEIAKVGASLHDEIDNALKMTPKELEESVAKNMKKLDVNKDGYISRPELDNANGDIFFKLGHLRTLGVLDKHFDTIQTLSNNEFGRETSGITLSDIRRIGDLKTSGTGFGALPGVAFDSVLSTDSLAASGFAGLAGGVGLRAALKMTAGRSLLGAAAIAGVTLIGSGLIGTAAHFSNKSKIDALLGDMK